MISRFKSGKKILNKQDMISGGRISGGISMSKNKTGTSKVGAISKAQIAQKTFFKKKLEILFFFLSENVA